MDSQSRICSYEGSAYRTDFWEGQGREYEDLAERIALRRLLPRGGRRLLDLGAGFGRLSEFYERYEQTVLLDYSVSLLRQAQERLGRDGRIRYVAADLNALPFADSAFDTAMMVRVVHHVEDVPAVLRQVARVLAPQAAYVLEFASKRHLKAIVRHLLGRQQWSPFEPSPVEFAEMNFDFHPAWMAEKLDRAGFHVKRRLTVSHFRLPLLKHLVPPRLLAALDGVCQPTGRWWQLTPSIFVQSTLNKPGDRRLSDQLFRCPACGSSLQESPEALACTACGQGWPVEDGIYNFKQAS